MRNAFANKITKISKQNKKIILLSGDIGNKLFDSFKKQNPDRFVNCGVAEANMTTVAAGLAYAGFTPITYTIASFNVFKTIEQIKIDICYQNLPVIIVGVGAGLGYSNLGTTHHSIEDIGILAPISNLNIVCPADQMELIKLLPQIIRSKKPTYLRLGKKNENSVYQKKCNSKLGKVEVIQKGTGICIFGTGNILHNAILASHDFSNKSKPYIVNIHTIKPLDKKTLIKYLRKFNKIIIIEEHVETGGLSTIIKKICSENKINNQFICHNTGSKFLVGLGDKTNSRKILRLDPFSIKKSIINLKKM